jgi:hypothetical protein
MTKRFPMHTDKSPLTDWNYLLLQSVITSRHSSVCAFFYPKQISGKAWTEVQSAVTVPMKHHFVGRRLPIAFTTYAQITVVSFMAMIALELKLPIHNDSILCIGRESLDMSVCYPMDLADATSLFNLLV